MTPVRVTPASLPETVYVMLVLDPSDSRAGSIQKLQSRTSNALNVLLLRPSVTNDRFGLGPFFRMEPLGMEYIAGALEARDHSVTLVDLRYGRSLGYYLRKYRPDLVGVASMHTLETEDALDLIRRVRRQSPDLPLIVGGHAAAAFPSPFFRSEVDAICAQDGERVIPELVDALASGRPRSTVGGLLLKGEDGTFRSTSRSSEAVSLDEVPLPSRRHVDSWRKEYACLQFRPMWLVETARGCSYRCKFCSVWPMFDRSFRERSIDAVCRDLASVGPHVFVADDLFWCHAARSLELASELLRRGIRKEYMLVQSRVDLVAQHADLLEAWRPVAKNFDIFFGLEAATDDYLKSLNKDTTTRYAIEAIRVARELRYGVTGNFVIDPDWVESDFERLWAFMDHHQLSRAGFTLLTPLPGTPFYEEMKGTIRATSWSQFDMHHLLWEPKLGVHRFFELYCETWRRSVLNLRGQKQWWQWAKQVKIRDLPFLAQLLRRTQHMMNPKSYLAEHRLADVPEVLVQPATQMEL